jgi:hypothetical protein
MCKIRYHATDSKGKNCTLLASEKLKEQSLDFSDQLCISTNIFKSMTTFCFVSEKMDNLRKNIFLKML